MAKSVVREAEVRDSLAKCLEKLEAGLTFIEKESRLPSSIGTTGFVDLLARDSRQRYVLVEVKKTEPATRDTLHEILKYIEAAKAHLGLRENELRVVVASVEWRELLVPFSSLVQRTTCDVSGYRLEVNDAGSVIAAEPIDPLRIRSERILAPWHLLTFYKDEQSLQNGIASYEEANAARAIESFVLIILDAPIGNPEGFPSTKQIANRRVLAEMATLMGNPVTDVPNDLYKSAIYFAMQQLSMDEYIARLPEADECTIETLAAISEMEEEEALATLHEALLDLDPMPQSDFTEIAYAAKFRSRLMDEEKWRVREIRRYGSFKRNSLLADDVIIDEIGGSQGNSKQGMKMSFHPNQKAEVAEVRRRVDECLSDNDPWRGQINFILTELLNSGEGRQCYIQIMNPSSAITTVYLAASKEDGALYIPTYQVRVPELDSERAYFGAMVHDRRASPVFDDVLAEFYEGDVTRLLFTLQWGGYESRDVEIMKKLGLRYRTYQVRIAGEERTFLALDNHEWEACDPIDPLNSYFSFLVEHKEFTRQVYELYSSRWDGGIIDLSGVASGTSH